MVLNANSWKFGKIRKPHVGVNLLVIQYSTPAKCCRQKHRRFLFKRTLNWVKLSAWNYFCWCCCLWVECMLRNGPALFEVPWQRSSCQSIVVYGKNSLFFNMTCVGIKLPFQLPGCQQRSVSRDERGYKGGTNEGRLYWLAGCREVCCDLCRTTEH